MMNAERIEEIRKRAEAATKGPWTANSYGVHSNHAISYNWARRNTKEVCALDDGEYIENQNKEADAEFIAHAREDIPALLAEVERLRAKITELGDCRCVMGAREALNGD